MKIFGCGDLFITKKLSNKAYHGFNEIQQLIMNHDVAFGNLETTVHNNEGYPACFPGGGWAMSDPERLKDLKLFGFNILNIANNHTMDYSHKGLEATINHLKKANIPYVGAGVNLTDASLPRYVECEDGRVAFIGVTSSFHDSDAAGPAGGIISGRPGVNPLRRNEYFQLSPELYQSLIKLADAVDINDTYKWAISNGYMDLPEELFLRNLKFTKGSENKRISHPLENDMRRIVASIEESKIQADCTVISFHSHQMSKNDEVPHEFIVEFCHRCIDAGADIIFGHGSHVLRGLEMYNGHPIFYGLGDFIFQNEMMEFLPKEFYQKNGIVSEYDDCVGIGMKKRSNDGTKGLGVNKSAWESIGVSVDYQKSKINSLIIYPISLNFELGRTQRGWPTLDDTGKILDRFIELSYNNYGTIIENKKEYGIII